MDTTVYSESQLADAVGTGNDYDYIYLGADIQIPFGGITIDPSKTSLVIDGLHDNTVHTITDYNSTSALNTLSIRSASNMTLTLKNMVITGRNYYGVPCIFESVNAGGVTLIYDHVTYTGPQITFHPDGLTRYIDCDITISYPPVTSRAEEVGEVNRVEFAGSNTITHEGTSDAVFWFRGTVGTAYLKVLENADVTISTVNYFMFSRTPLIPTTNNPVLYEIEPNASFTLTSNHGISYTSEHRASSFLVDTGASFRYIQETSNGNIDSLYLNGAFTVNEGASVYMQANFDNARPLINFISGDDQIKVDNPKSFVLYNKSNSVIEVGSSDVTRPFLITGGQLNQWDDATLFPGAGDLDDDADYRWHRPSWNSFTMQGSVASLSTVVDSTTFTPEELENLPDPEDLSFQNAKVISIGNVSITPDFMADDGRPISGYTEPYAEMRISYTDAGGEHSFDLTAGAHGSYLLPMPASIPAGTIITISSNTPFLITSIEITVAAAVDEIILQKVPSRISFRIPPVSTDPYVLLRRINPTEAVEVLDSRSVGTQWELLASVTEPLTTPDGEVSGNTVVFKDADGTVSELSEIPVVVYTGGPTTGETFIFWNVEHGILVRVTEPIHSGVEYTTELEWELRIIT